MKLIRKILTFLFSIILFLVVMAVMLLTSTKNIISKENITNYINNSNVLELPANQVFYIDENIDNNLTIKDTIVAMAINSKIPEAIVDDLVNGNDLNNLLGDFVKNTIDYAIMDSDAPTISNEAIEALINVVNQYANNHIDIVMEEELTSYVNDYISDLNEMVPARDLIINESNENSILKQIITFNINYLYIGVTLLLVLIGLIAWNLYTPIKTFGIINLILGIIFTIIGCLEFPIYNLFKNSFVKIEDLFHSLLNQVLSICFKEGVIYTVVGVALIILGILINRFVKNKQKLEETRRINIEDIKL